MADRIDRIEREFILTEAGAAGVMARVQAAGRSFRCRLATPTRELVRFAPSNGEATVLKTWDRVNINFDFQGKAIVFDSLVRKAGHGVLDLAWPDNMYRGLLRRWPRVPAPADMTAGLILPDSGLRLDCPVSPIYEDLSPLWDSLGDGGAGSLQAIVDEFRVKARDYAGTGRVGMYTDGRGPADAAEDIAVRTGLVLFIPTAAGVPVADCREENRIVTQDILAGLGAGPETGEVEPASSIPAPLPAEAFAAWLSERAREGLESALYAPIRYHRYVVGMVRLENSGREARKLDFRAVEFAQGFSRRLAAGLERHGYFTRGAGSSGSAVRTAPLYGAIINASPGGLLLGLRKDRPLLPVGMRLGIRLTFGGAKLESACRIARRFDSERGARYGLVLEDLPAKAGEAVAYRLYGSPELAAPCSRG